MKTVLRIGLILLVALAISGIFYGLSLTPAARSMADSGPGEGRSGRGGEAFEMEGGERPEGFQGRGGRGEGGGDREGRDGGGLPFETVGHLVLIGIITAVVVAFTWLFDKFRAMRRKPTPPAEEAAPTSP